MKKIFIFLIPFFVLFSASFSAQTIWYVTPTGAGTQNGSSWANARSLQNAVANLNSGQTELRLRQGNYLISSTLRIDWGRKVRLIGGYSGVGTTRNYTLYPTNLNGQNTTQIMYIQEDDCSIDGVNFINGFATGANEGGAGLVLRTNIAQIRNSTFRNNISEGGRGAGALYLMHGFNGAVLIDNCTFENNRSNHKVYPMGDNGGGAIHNWSDNVTIRNSVFRNNYAENEGGAIYSWGENFHLENTRFENNTTETQGGGIYINYYDVTLKNTQFVGNKADEGGGIFISGTSLSVENSQFTNNEAQEGGALNSSFGKWDFLNTVFRNNKASEKGGAIYNHRFSEISTINKSEFYDNAAKQGGAIYNFSDEGLKISNAIFHKNLASDKGGAIYNYRNIDVANATFIANTNTAFIIPTYANTPSNPNISHIYNSIFYQNTPKTGGFRADIHSENVSADHGEKDIRRNITQSYTAGTANLVGVNPLFINNATNFRLQQTSPAVNYGVNALYNQVSATPAGTSTDLGNQPRLVGSSIDLGAYELQPVVLACPAMTLPTPNATNVPITTNISWNAIANATGYRISIGTTAGGTNIVNNLNVENVTTYNHPTDLSPGTTYYVRITPYNAVSVTPNCGEYSFTTANPTVTIPSCSTITIPTNNATNVSINPTITWTASSGATGYRIRIGTIVGGNDVLNQNLGNVTSFTLPSNLNYSTNYFVRVIPFNSAGDATGCSEHQFTTESTPITVPNCSTITSPTNNATNVSINPTITWTVSSGATGYRIRIGTTAGGNDILNQNLGNVTSFTLPSNLNYSTNYFVRIIPFNSAGDATGCSEHRFTTQNAPVSVPACSTITFPTNNATNVSINPTITWTVSSGATGYRIRISTTAGGNDILNQNVGNVTTFDLPNNLNYSTQYFVRIIPSNSAGQASGCSVTNFTTEAQPITVPACTAATVPANGATNIGIATNFSWTAVTGATSYTLQIGTVSGTWNILNQNVGNVTTFDLPNNLNYSTQYFVRIIPSNSAGSASGCSVTNFITEAQPVTVPACTAATVPANGATNIGIATNFSWTAVTGATSYTLQIGTVSGTWDILNQNVGNVTTFDLPTNLTYSTQYFVRIIPSNSAGSASGCSVTNFITEAQPVTVPACTSATIPANGATNIGIATNFSWTAVTGATSYTLQIGTASGTWNILNQNVGNVTTFDLPNNLNYSTQYFVRIIPSNSAGSASGCSVTNFTTEAQPITVPACTSATIPANGATNIGIATNFSWTAVTGATSYTLQIGTVSGTWNIINQNVGNVTTFNLPNDLNYSTQYFVRIIPRNSAGNATGCTVTNFTTEAQPITVPACTSATIPANGATSIDIATNISWTAVTGATSYTLQIGTASGTWNILNQNVGNVTTFNLPNDLNYSTQYFVRIIPSNSAGQASGCSVTNFTTQAQPITVPACTAATIPANGATNVGIATNFSWTAVTGATSYTLQIGTASGTWDILNQNVGNVTTFDLPNNLNYSTQYFVRIIPSNSAGSASGCSVTNFTTQAQPITVPACTSATVPANGATNIDIATNFSWTAVTGATSYTLQIGTASGTWDILNQDVGNVTTFDLPNNLNYSTQYFVRIIPSNSAGQASGCSVTNFTTQAQPITVPACTSATVPANGATNIDIATNFSWTAVTGATSYTLQIGTASGTWDILNQDVGNVTTFDLPNNLNYSTQYFVRIIPSNSAGPASGCSVTNFITEAQPITVPACTSATTPANGATNIDIATNFSWTAVTGATSYTLQIGTASGTWDILNQDVGNVTTFDLPNNLNYSTQYFVRIIPSNSAGSASGCSVTNFITVYGDEDGDGVTDDEDQCPNTPLGIPVDSNGCPVCSAPLMTTINIQENDAEISFSGGISPFNYRVDNGLWQSTSSNSIVLNDLEGGLHTIEINSADTCETILEFSIIEIHNVITPNGDGINDVLDLSTLLLKEEPKLIIFDRYSNKIFEGNANNQFIWDGKLNGRPIKTDSYWFYMQWKEPNSQTPSKKQGWILVKNR